MWMAVMLWIRWFNYVFRALHGLPEWCSCYFVHLLCMHSQPHTSICTRVLTVFEDGFIRPVCCYWPTYRTLAGLWWKSVFQWNKHDSNCYRALHQLCSSDSFLPANFIAGFGILTIMLTSIIMTRVRHLSVTDEPYRFLIILTSHLVAHQTS